MAFIPGMQGVNDALGGMFGPDGFLIQMIPGGQPVLLIAGVIIAIELVRRFYSEGTSKKFWQEFAVLGLISLMAFGNASVMIMLTLIVLGLAYLSKHMEMKSERLTPEEKQIEKDEVGELVERMGALENALRQQVQGTDDESVLYGTIGAEFQLAIAAAEKQAGEAMQRNVQALTAETQTESRLLGTIEGITNSMGKYLAHPKFETMEQIDEFGKKTLGPYFTNVVIATGQLAESERKTNTTRIQFITTLAKDVVAIMDLSEKSKHVARHLEKLEKQLAKNVGQKTINNVKVVLQAKQDKLKSLKQEIKKMFTGKAGTSKEIKTTYSGQINLLEQGIKQLQDLLTDLNSMQTELKGAITSSRETLWEAKRLIEQLIAYEKPASEHLAKILNILLEIQKIDLELTAAGKNLREVLNKLKQAETDENIIVEESLITATTSIGKVFSVIEKLQRYDEKTHKDGTLPLIKDMQKIMTTSEGVSKSINTLINQLFDIATGVAQLTEGAEKLVKNTGQQDKRIFQLLEANRNFMWKEEQVRKATTQQASNSLNQTKASIEKHIGQLAGIIARAQADETRLIASINKFLKDIVDNKTRLQKEFGQKAQQFQTRMAAAQRPREGAPARPTIQRAA